MKVTMSLIAGTLGLSLSVTSAADKTNCWSPNGSWSLSLQERYIAIRVSRVPHNGLSLWSDLNINLPEGFYVNIWDHHGIEGRDKSKQPDELDLAFGWRRQISWYDLEVGLATSYLNNSPLGLWLTHDALSQAATISKTYAFGQHTLKPQIRVEWMSLATDFDGGSFILMPNVSHVWRQPFSTKPLCFTHPLFMVHDDGFVGPKNDSEGYFLRWNAGLRWQLSKRMTLTLPSYAAQIPLHKGNDGRGQATSWGTMLTWSF